MTFNPDRAKQVKEVTFSRKTRNSSHPRLYFHNAIVKHNARTEALHGLQPSWTWWLVCKFQLILTCSSLMIIKVFRKPLFMKISGRH